MKMKKERGRGDEKHPVEHVYRDLARGFDIFKVLLKSA